MPDGWTLTPSSVLRRGNKCHGDNSWYNYSYGPFYEGEGSIKTTLHGCGKAELDFGECWNSDSLNYHIDHYTQVKLNGIEIGRAKEVSKKIQFNFKEGDVLELRDRGYTVIRFNDFTILSCYWLPYQAVM